MSKYFKASCPICHSRLHFFHKKKDVMKRFKHFTTDCHSCGNVLAIDIKSKRRIDVEPLVIEYHGRILNPEGYVTN